MNDIISDLDQWLIEGETAIALATVVSTWGSAPRKAGAKMAMTASGRIIGSVSGGCVEGAVVEAGLQTLETGIPQLLHFGVADETAWEVGLACGGEIDIFVEPFDPDNYQTLRRMIVEEQAGVSATVIAGPDDLLGKKVTILREGPQEGSLGEDLDRSIREIMPELASSKPASPVEGIKLFVDLYRPAPTLIIVGGVHTAIALTKMAKVLGYGTIVVDPRRAFGNVDRFPHVDQLHQQWPQKIFPQLSLTGDTAVALLTHDPKIDDPALKILLDSPVFYIGALGSRKTHAKRVKRLQAMGFDEASIARIHAPIGIPIGSANPEEIALSILAEVVSVRRGENKRSR